MKILKSRKALSPVVASIILIAVTVAVSLAVAVWMGSLTTGQMQTEQLSFISHQWDTVDTVDWFVFTVKNTGSADLSIQDVRIDGVPAASVKYKTTSDWQDFSASVPLAKGELVSFNVTRSGGFAHGITYEFTVITARGNTFGPYVKTAP
ncbi:MAG: archaellin/type IV pilin N-terminal domain-containing protein [Candidatus Bathyarchaeia archaeon]